MPESSSRILPGTAAQSPVTVHCSVSPPEVSLASSCSTRVSRSVTPASTQVSAAKSSVPYLTGISIWITSAFFSPSVISRAAGPVSIVLPSVDKVIMCSLL